MSDPLVISLPTELVIHNAEALFTGMFWGYFLPGMFFSWVLTRFSEEDDGFLVRLWISVVFGIFWPLLALTFAKAHFEKKKELRELKEDEGGDEE